MTVILAEQLLIDGVVRDVGYEYTGPEAVEADIVLTDFDIHYQRDSNGSVLETSKVAGD